MVETLPELLSIFKKIVCERKEYCYVCLRTDEERRLVTPNYFKKFVAAVNIHTNGVIHKICHMCERQALNALKFNHSSIFASSLSLMINEFHKKEIPNTTAGMFEKRFFNGVLKSANLSHRVTPELVHEELQCIRNFGYLSETDVLVMDNKQVYESTPIIDTTKKDYSNIQILQDAIIECPITTVQNNTEKNMSITSRFDSSTQSYIILDENDDPKESQPTQPPQPTQPSNEISILPTTNVVNQASNLYTNLVVTVDPPKLQTLQDLVRQPQTDNNVLLHPIFLGENGMFNVPSLSAVIINGNLVLYDGLNRIKNTHPLNINMDVIKQNLLSNNEVFIQHSLFNMAAKIDVNSCQTDSSCQPKKKKTDSSLEFRKILPKGQFSSNNIGKGLLKNITISDISSDMDRMDKGQNKSIEQTKTDWEDKIPMDVISFVDAMDPNANSVLRNTSENTGPVVVGDARSLGKDVGLDCEIIDLC